MSVECEFIPRGLRTPRRSGTEKGLSKVSQAQDKYTRKSSPRINPLNPLFQRCYRINMHGGAIWPNAQEISGSWLSKPSKVSRHTSGQKTGQRFNSVHRAPDLSRPDRNSRCLRNQEHKCYSLTTGNCCSDSSWQETGKVKILADPQRKRISGWPQNETSAPDNRHVICR